MRLESWTEPAQTAVGHVACWKVRTLPWTHVSPVWLADALLVVVCVGRLIFEPFSA